MNPLFTTLLLCLGLHQGFSQSSQAIPLNRPEHLQPVKVALSLADYKGKQALRVVDTAKGLSSEDKFVKIKDLRFRNGRIDLEVSGKPLNTASETARGFVGIAFRVADDNSRFECIYLRPTNGRAADQVRRNHSVQYISFPDYPWERSRKETPEKYESYVDLVPGEWTKVRIEVKGNTARLYVHGAQQPTLLVNDLKLGADQAGSIGLWVGSGTEAHFANLVVTPEP